MISVSKWTSLAPIFRRRKVTLAYDYLTGYDFDLSFKDKSPPLLFFYFFIRNETFFLKHSAHQLLTVSQLSLSLNKTFSF